MRLHVAFKLLATLSICSMVLIYFVARQEDDESESPSIPGRKALSSKDTGKTDPSKKVSSSRLKCLQQPINPDVRTIYMVTPTYRRAEQIPELTRTAQTLLHVTNLVWIVVEDAKVPSPEVVSYLQESGINHVYLRAEMPTKFLKVKNKPRGVANRNAGITWVRENAESGVIYFGDDDNTYDIRIFEEIRYTKGVSMFPVGLVTDFGVSTPIVRNGIVIGFYDGWVAKRKFPVDMAGFAVNIDLLHQHPNASMPFKVGYEEDGLLKSLKINASDIEPKAQNCTKIWVWHTQTKKTAKVKDGRMKPTLINTNLVAIRKQVWRGS